MNVGHIKELFRKFNKNQYSINNVDDEENFFKICLEYNKEFEKIQKEMASKNNIKNYSLSEQKELYSRIESIRELNEELENSYIIDEDFSIGNNPIEYTKRMAIFAEICNNSAHLIEKYIDRNELKKDKSLRELKATLFNFKQSSIMKIVQNSLGREKDGIIAGIKGDESKYENTNVFVVDIPGIGQVSWHVDIEELDDEIKDLLKENEYPFKIEKSKSDSREKTLNSDLLLGKVPNRDLNVHNRIDANIPSGSEDELKKALLIYNEVIDLQYDMDEIERTALDEVPLDKLYRRFMKACKKHVKSMDYRQKKLLIC